jgi:hypothetical protein
MSLDNIRIPAARGAVAAARPIMSGRNPRGNEVGVTGHSLLWYGTPPRLRIHALPEGAAVFFDRKPQLREGVALDLRRVWAWRQDSVDF